MISFKQFITEVFGSSSIYPWRPYRDGYKFDTPFNGSYFAQIEYFPKSRSYEISFGLISELIKGYPPEVTMSLTKNNNLRDTIKIYNTVIDIIRKEVKPRLKSGDSIWFMPADVRTLNVYKKFAKMAAKEIDGIVKINRGLIANELEVITVTKK